MLVNGNQTASLLSYYLLSQWSERGKLTGKEYIVKTIVTTELIADMARYYKVPYWDVLTGFKFIADIIRRNEDTMTFIGGGEESYGFMIGDFVRDKDAVSSCAMLAEIAAWAKSRGMSMYDILMEMYRKFSLYQESLINVVRKGKSGAEEIQQMMADFRTHPPKSLAWIEDCHHPRLPGTGQHQQTYRRKNSHRSCPNPMYCSSSLKMEAKYRSGLRGPNQRSNSTSVFRTSWKR